MRGRGGIRAAPRFLAMVLGVVLLGATDGVAQVPAGAEGGVALTGVVRADGLRADGLLPGAVVEVRQGSRRRTATVGADGAWRVGGLEGGLAEVAVFHLAAHHLALAVELPSRGEVRLDLELTPRVLAIPGITARAHPALLEPVTGRSPTATTATVRTIGAMATTGLVESGLAGVLRTLPGEENPTADRVLFMRGSTVDVRTVLLDGAPVLTPFHVAGLVSPFEADLLGHASLFNAGAPASYEGGLSYLLDVDTRAPRPGRVRGSFALDGLLVRGVAETPLPGGGGLIAGGRHLHAMQERATGGSGGFPYAYDDLLIRWTLPVAQGHHVHFTGFRNREAVKLDELLLGRAQAEWGNRVSSLRYTGRIGGAGVRASLASSRYESALPLGLDEPVLASGAADHDRATLDVVLPRDGWRLRAGLSAERLDYRYAMNARLRLWQDRGETPPVLVVGGERAAVSTRALGGYLEAELPLGDRSELRVGSRIQHHGGGEGLRVGPRATLRHALTPEARLTVAAGRYHQPVPRPGLLGTESDIGLQELSWNPGLPIASATHLLVSLDQFLGEELEVGVSGFVKTFEGVEAASSRRLLSSGTDLRLTRSGERLSGWLGYTLSWFWEEAAGPLTSSLFSGRHLISSGVRAGLPGGLEGSLTAAYGAGLPLTSVPLSSVPGEAEDFRVGGVRRLNTSGAEASPLELMPEDDFVRLDFELSRELTPKIGGRRSELRPYLRVINALDRRDALFHYFDRWREGGVQPVANRPLLPLIGVEWRF